MFRNRETMIALRARRQAFRIVRELIYGPAIYLPKPPPSEGALPAPDPHSATSQITRAHPRVDLTRLYALSFVALIALATAIAIFNRRWMHL